MSRTKNASAPSWLIADDLTGALDAAVAFVAVAQPLVVELRPAAAAMADSDGSWRAVDAETRDADTGTAVARIAEITSHISRQDRVFKKVDSLLRGAIGAELETMHMAFAGRLIVLAPALPAELRFTRDGKVLTADGTDVAYGGSVARAVAPLASAVVPAAPAEQLRETLARLRQEGVAVAICDAQSSADLDALAAAGRGLGDGSVIWCGSAGLAHALARADGTEPSSARPAGLPADPRPLIIVGSYGPTGRRQAVALAAHIPEITLPVPSLLASDETQRARLAHDLARRIGIGPLLVTLAGPVDLAASNAVARALAAVCAPAVRAARTVILSGGATAYAVLQAAGVVALRVRGELEPGVVVSVDADSGRHVVTKSGGFGDDQALVRAAAAFGAVKPTSVEVPK